MPWQAGTFKRINGLQIWHDSARRPPGYSPVVAVLGGVAYGLIQVALLLVGVVLLAAAWVVCAAKWRIKRCTRHSS